MSDKIYEASFRPSQEILEAFVDFYAIVGQLRRDCPWDREQTHTSVKHMLIEEAYEALEAIDTEDWRELSRELGDVLLHVLFHSDIGGKGHARAHHPTPAITHASLPCQLLPKLHKPLR